MARYSLDPNNLMVQSFITGSETEAGAETIAEEPVDGIRDTRDDYTCAYTCGATCGRTCDGGWVCGFQSAYFHCASNAKAC